MKNDFLAVCFIGAGSSYGRAPDKDKAVALCQKSVEQDWSTLFDLDGQECKINVYDVSGHDSVWWDYQVHDEKTGETIPRIDLVTVTLKVRRRKM